MMQGRHKAAGATGPEPAPKDPLAAPRKITIRDVAREAGVGVGTVSRVLNDHPAVSAQMRARIRAVMAQMDYRPDQIAQDLGRRFTKCLGVVVPDLANPFFAELVQALEQAARAGVQPLPDQFDRGSPHRSGLCRFLFRRRIDGLFLIRCQAGSADYAGYDLPIIHVDRLAAPQTGTESRSARHPIMPEGWRWASTIWSASDIAASPCWPASKA
ncbi:LacI family DNA-binding transcriptional regulator [Paracoccus cavernae]|uniref:LacI family DNA-binding transcriptional regulator n=1 Tax=Paracoccus cavernae TaxID=1571207 RepID=A0ABT8D6K8_9RHOB|nr:LacI family DNA-binding transcriptional regulator [Paracoccus cavernae]